MAYQRQWDKASRDAWQRQRIAGELASGRIKSTPQLEAFLAGKPMPRNPIRPSVFDQINKNLKTNLRQQIGDEAAKGKNGKQPSMAAVEAAAKKHKTLQASLPSTCFSSLSWRDGVATGVFINPTAGEWSWECDLQTFIAWAQSGSLGEFFNAEIR